MASLPTLQGATALILAGGFGTRLRPVVADRPKVLAEVLGRPFVFHILDRLAPLGIRDVVFCTGYMAEALERAVGGEYRGMRIHFSREDSPLGTGGALALAASRHPAPLVLAMNGDSLATADLEDFARFAAAQDCDAALLLASVPDTARYGRVELAPDGSGRIAGFTEKGRTGEGLINAGVYLLRPGALAGLAPGAAASIETDVFPALAASGRLMGHSAEGGLLDIGTPESYAEAGRFLAGDFQGRAAVFLDRDGTIIAERHYLCDPAGVELLPGAAEGLRRMRALGLPLVVVTNQSGVGRGYFGMDAVERVHGRLIELLAAEGVDIAGIYSCPHAPDESCGCRKPQPGLLRRAAGELGIDPARSFVIGDKPCDIDLGLVVSATTFLVRTGYGERHAQAGDCKPHFVVTDLAEAASHIEQALRSRAAKHDTAPQSGGLEQPA